MAKMAIVVVSFFLALLWSVLMLSSRFRRPLERAFLEVQGHLLEVSLYGAFPTVMARSLRSLLGACGRLSSSLLKPSILFALPLGLGLLVLSGTTAYSPASVGEPLLVWIEPEPTGPSGDWNLQAPLSINVEVDRFHPLGDTRRYWRLRPQEAGRYSLKFASQRGVCEKSLIVGEESVILNPSRRPFGVRWLLSPWEPPLGQERNLEEVHVDYPEAVIAWGGTSFSWELVFFLAFLGWTFLLAFVVRPGNPKRS